MKKEQTFRDRLKTARLACKKLTQAKAAKLAGMTQQSWQALESGKSKKPRNVTKIAQVLKVDPAWLLFGENIMPFPNEEKIVSIKHVPVLKWSQVNLERDLHLISETEEFIPMLAVGSEKTFALKVMGDSMISSMPGKDSFTDKDYIFVDPDREAINGNFVIAMQKNSTEALFKQYIIDGNKKYLRPLNHQYPMIEIDHTTKIIGVVIGKFTSFK